eukprot:Pgem_evm1s3018
MMFSKVFITVAFAMIASVSANFGADSSEVYDDIAPSVQDDFLFETQDDFPQGHRDTQDEGDALMNDDLILRKLTPGKLTFRKPFPRFLPPPLHKMMSKQPSMERRSKMKHMIRAIVHQYPIEYRTCIVHEMYNILHSYRKRKAFVPKYKKGRIMYDDAPSSGEGAVENGDPVEDAGAIEEKPEEDENDGPQDDFFYFHRRASSHGRRLSPLNPGFFKLMAKRATRKCMSGSLTDADHAKTITIINNFF